MKNLDYDMNMPVHLARRDVFFDKAKKALSGKISKDNLEKHAAAVVKALLCLKSAEDHAFLLIKQDGSGFQGDACVALMNIMHNQLTALRLIFDSGILLEKRKEAVLPFMKEASSDLEKEKERLFRAARILWEEAMHTVTATAAALLASRKTAIKTMSKEDMDRYLKASKDLKKHVKHKPKSADTMSEKVFCAIPEITHE